MQDWNKKRDNNINLIIEKLESLLEHYESISTGRCNYRSVRWALACAIEMCRKQVAKAPLPHIESQGICAKCSYEFLVKHKYCPNCGQKIDWKE